jgi:hypothetical protein
VEGVLWSSWRRDPNSGSQAMTFPRT